MIPNNSQERAIHHVNGPMLVLAGPGSGKTFCIIERIFYLVEILHILPTSILCITFSRASANEMEERYNKIVNKSDGASRIDDMRGVTFRTFHALFFDLLREFEDYKTEDLCTEEKKLELVRILAKEMPEEYLEGLNINEKLIKELNKRKEKRNYEDNKDVIDHLLERYELYLKENRILDFDDLGKRCLEMLKNKPEILKVCQERFPYILVDEFQDVNEIQFEIVKLLAGNKRNLYVVGDDDQSIYGFRGSSPDIINRYKASYEDTKIVHLTVNYRCSKEIVARSKRLISHNFMREEKDLRSFKEDSGIIIWKQYATVEDEYTDICRQIMKHIYGGGSPSDIGVLFRTTVGVNSLKKYFTKYKIPYSERKEDKVTSLSTALSDIYNYLHLAALLDRGTIDTNLLRGLFLSLVNKPDREFKRSSLDSININEFMSGLSFAGRLPVSAAVKYVLKNMRYESYLELTDSDSDEIVQKVQRVYKKYDTYASAEEFLNDVPLNELLKESDIQESCVQLMTLHGSKGLEFPVVFIADVCEGIMPHARSVKEGNEEEERRLFYVGMTRAKNELHLLYTESMYGKRVQPSRFLCEMYDD